MNHIVKKSQIKKVAICSTLIIILILSSIDSGAKHTTEYLKKKNTECYGFIIPLPSGEDTTHETFLDSKISHLINDLLRENITVYRLPSNFSILSKEIFQNGNAYEIIYKKGAFIIPFSGDIYTDALVTSILCDYNKSSELGEDSLRIEIYEIMTPLNLATYELVEPKIAQHLGTPTRYAWPCYMQIAESGGFLTMEFLLDNETLHHLNNNDFNVFMWPYRPEPGSIIEVARSLYDEKSLNL